VLLILLNKFIVSVIFVDEIVSDWTNICVVPVEMPYFAPKLNVLFPVHTLLPPKETDEAEFAFTNAVVATLVELSDDT